MNVRQLFYTSCERGLQAAKGFQTYAMSEGISYEERIEIERYCLYKPPLHLPSQPTAEEISGEFPDSFTFFQLNSSGRYGLCQANYVGQDYSGRYGNYFCHVLILEEGLWPAYPIQYYQSDIFRNGLSEAEAQITTTPPPLPVLTLAAIPLNPYVNFSEVAEFVGGDGMEMIKTLLSATLLCHEHHKRIVIADEPGRAAFWIAALQMSLPLDLAHHLSFTTYAQDPADTEVLIRATPTEGSAFAFSRHQRETAYFVFDFGAGNSSEIPWQSDFADQAAVSYGIAGEETLTQFKQFLAGFSDMAADTRLEAAYHLFRLTSGQVENLAMADMQAAVAFAGRHATDAKLEQIVTALNPESLAPVLDVTTAETVCEFLFATAGRLSGEIRYTEAAYVFFDFYLDALVYNTDKLEDTQLLGFNQRVRERVQPLQNFVNHATTAQRLQRIRENIGHAKASASENTDHAKASAVAMRYVWITIDNIVAGDDKKPVFLAEDPEESFRHWAETALQHISPNDIPALFQTLGRLCLPHGVFFADVTVFLCDCADDKAISSKIGIAEILAAEPAFGDKARKRLIEHNAIALLLADFSERLHAHKKPVAFFWDYHKTWFKPYPAYAQAGFSRATERYLAWLPAKQADSYHEECGKLLDYHELLEPAVMTKVIDENLKDLPLSQPDKKQRQRLVALNKLGKQSKSPITGHEAGILSLCIAGMEIEDNISKEDITVKALLDKQKIDFISQLSVEKYANYLDWVLPLLLSYGPSETEHQLIMRQYQGAEDLSHKRMLIRNYMEALSGVTGQTKKPDGKQVLLSFLVYYFKYVRRQHPEFSAWMWRDIVDLLEAQPKELLGFIVKNLPGQKGLVTALQKEWGVMWSEVIEGKEKSAKGGILGWFGR